MQSFNTEIEMGIRFESYIKRINKNPNILIVSEQKKLFGIPDFILLEKVNEREQIIVSIELKLFNWRRALKQAFRYKTFSNLAFVILDENKVSNALKEINQFKRFNIGLGSFNKCNEVKVYYYPNIEDPYSEHLVRKLLSSIDLLNQPFTLGDDYTIDHFINRFYKQPSNKESSLMHY